MTVKYDDVGYSQYDWSFLVGTAGSRASKRRDSMTTLREPDFNSIQRHFLGIITRRFIITRFGTRRRLYRYVCVCTMYSYMHVIDEDM